MLSDLTAAALAMQAQGMSVPQIAASLVITEGKNAGQHPSLASVYRVLAEGGRERSLLPEQR